MEHETEVRYDGKKSKKSHIKLKWKKKEEKIIGANLYLELKLYMEIEFILIWGEVNVLSASPYLSWFLPTIMWNSIF